MLSTSACCKLGQIHCVQWISHLRGFMVGSSSNLTNATGHLFPVLPVVGMPQGYIPGYACEMHPLWILTQKLIISRDGDCPEVILVRER